MQYADTDETIKQENVGLSTGWLKCCRNEINILVVVIIIMCAEW